MLKKVCTQGRVLWYNLEYKDVKNINLRIRPSGEIYVSASKRVSQSVIEEFIISRAEFIFKALDNFEKRAKTPVKRYFSESKVCEVITELCKKAHPYFEKKGIQYPQIKFKKLKSRWGSCQPTRGILTFNINLMYAPIECIWYVVLHEFTHFIVANHSKKFYLELEKVCPDWKEKRKVLKDIPV